LNGSLLTILEYCDGNDLDHILKKNKRLSEKETRVIIRQLISALEYLDRQQPKIIHYDIKPHNILIDSSGTVKLTDFGLCKIFDDESSKMELTSQGVGTYWYLPPECFYRDDDAYISNKVDIWSMGVVTFQMLYGVKPFGNKMSQERIKNENIILRSKQVTFPSKPNVSVDMKNFIKKCLEYDQDQRMTITEASLLFNR
jgi:tousled-like kinase